MPTAKNAAITDMTTNSITKIVLPGAQPVKKIDSANQPALLYFLKTRKLKCLYLPRLFLKAARLGMRATLSDFFFALRTETAFFLAGSCS